MQNPNIFKIMNMKLLFLDIDGVLNSASGNGPYISDMEVSKLKLLNKLIDEIGNMAIVITSDRRMSKIDLNNKIKAFNDFGIKVAGITRFPEDNSFDNRGKQILDYISNCHYKVEKYLILDDNDDNISQIFKEKFVLINKYYGFNDDAYHRCICLLDWKLTWNQGL